MIETIFLLPFILFKWGFSLMIWSSILGFIGIKIWEKFEQ